MESAAHTFAQTRLRQESHEPAREGPHAPNDRRVAHLVDDAAYRSGAKGTSVLPQRVRQRLEHVFQQGVEEGGLGAFGPGRRWLPSDRRDLVY